MSKIDKSNLLQVSRKNQDKSNNMSQERSTISEMSATPSELRCEEEFVPNQEENGQY